jgi:hypothetical protein
LVVSQRSLLGVASPTPPSDSSSRVVEPVANTFSSIRWQSPRPTRAFLLVTLIKDVERDFSLRGNLFIDITRSGRLLIAVRLATVVAHADILHRAFVLHHGC